VRRKKMSEKKAKLKPIRKARNDLTQYARRTKAMRERFVAQGRRFSDSAEIVRSDRDSR
jgi:hypothetical protein